MAPPRGSRSRQRRRHVAQLLPHVFDMFVQGDAAPDRAEGGLGLGLAVVKNLVERHGGRVAAASDGLGKGSTFTVWWPLAHGITVASLEESQDIELPMRLDARAGGRRQRRCGGDARRAPQGARSRAARRARRTECSRAPREEAPQLALVDLGLPLLDGYELIARLRNLPGLHSIPAIAVTGYGQPSDRAKSHAAGFDRHVVKPVGLEDLRTLLASL